MYARLRRRAGIIEVTFRYDPDVVEAIKTLPGYARRWDPDRRVWAVLARYEEPLVYILEGCGLVVYWEDAERRRETRRETGPGGAGPWATLHLLPDAPLPVAEAAYRAMAKLYHPDAHPGAVPALANEVMVRVNLAIEEIREKARGG